MRRRYADCQRKDGNCAECSLVNYGLDCHNKPITKMEWYIRAAGMDLAQLSGKSGVNVRQIQRVMLGESDAGNMSARNLLAIADALGVDPKELL